MLSSEPPTLLQTCTRAGTESDLELEAISLHENFALACSQIK